MNDNTDILVCFAIKEEAKPFQRIAKGEPSVRVLVSGMGKRNAENAVLAFLEQQIPRLVLTCGFAGGLDPTLAFGTVVYEENTGAGLSVILEQLGAVRVRFYCASRMMITPAEKRLVYEKTGSGAVEMESGSIAAMCRERNIPCATIRVISDTADEELPLNFNLLMAPDGRIGFARLGLAVLQSPGIVPRLLALRKRTSMAAENLARILADLLRMHGG
jgi:adenosylhomocysteine nucleosidase